MIPIAKPLLGEEEAAAAREAILSGWVTQGPKVKLFEDEFAKFVGSKHACAVSSCTTALHLALLAVGVKPGDVVITVSHSFIATANAIRHCGAEPVFVDIDPDTYNMAPSQLMKVLTENCSKKNGLVHYNNVEQIAVGESPLAVLCRYKKLPENIGRVAAILPVHQMGFPCDIEAIAGIARDFNLPVVEDAACAIGSELSRDGGHTWEKIGKPHGDVACFSFHPRKVITTGDGGMLTTNSDELDAKFRLLRQHGMSVPDTVRHGADRIIFEDYETTGFNYRMTDIQAAVGIEQLKRLDWIIEKRRFLADRYIALSENFPGLECIRIPSTIRPNWQSFPYKSDGRVSFDQMTVMQKLLDHGIATRRGIMNSHSEKPYSGLGWSLPASDRCRDQTILLPLFPDMLEKDQDIIVVTLRRVLTGEPI